MASLPAHANSGDLIKSTDWNAILDVVDGLTKDKLNVAGGTINGALSVTGALSIGGAAQPGNVLTIRSPGGAYLSALGTNGLQTLLIGADGNGGIVSTMTNHDLQLRAGTNSTKMIVKAGGNIGIGTLTPDRALTVAGGGGTYLNVISDNGGHEVLVGADSSGGIVSTMSNHDLQLRAGANSLKVLIKADGKVGIGVTTPGLLLDVADRVRFRQGGAGSAGLWFFQTTPNNDRAFVGMLDDNTVGFWGNTGIGWGFRMNTSTGNVFVAGALTAGGGKGGYVIDNFINAVGDALEQGDVIVLAGSDASKYYGVGDSIPVPEVDLTGKAYDTRVCGIVDLVVTSDDLPPFHPHRPTEAEINAVQAEKNASRRKKAQQALDARMEHPLQSFAPATTDTPDTSKVGNGQLGKMVTLGAYAFCKVDAEIAPIAVGDLLTTSPTKGHAQKVLEPDKAVGAIIGKALGSLNKGKGKIPVLVLLH